MRPSAEQLIRDYLNRLSVAARTRLQSDDRRAFLARTREYIERQSGGRDTADPAAVLRALNDLGEPEAVVEREHARLAALQSKRDAAAARSGLWKSKARAEAGRTGSGDGDSGKSKGGKKGAQPTQGPSRPPSQPKLNGRPLTGEITISSRPISARWKPGAPLQEQPSRARRMPRPRRGSSRQPAGGPVLEQQPVGQPGQRVVEGLVLKLLFELALVGHIPQGEDQAGHGRVVAEITALQLDLDGHTVAAGDLPVHVAGAKARVGP